MPDLKSELSKVINSWEAPTQAASKPEPTPKKEAEDKPYFTVTNNVCRATFECILDNPGKTRTEIGVMLEKDGFKRSSTTSLMGQMVKQGLVLDSHGLMYANSMEYKPLKSAKVWANYVAKQAAEAPKRKRIEIVNKRTGEVITTGGTIAASTLPMPQINSTWDADVMLNSLSIVQARALYDSLRKIFGG